MAKPVAHYSPSVGADGWLFVSGQVGLAEGGLVAGGVEAEARQALANLTAVLAEAGTRLTDVVKCTVFLADIDDFAVVNGIYAEVFGDHRPARSMIAAGGLPLGARVEIEAVAFSGP
jgi:2-iminobutanoate/2-iminopropanoate deaminase